MDMVTLKISGMACGGCANSVQQALLALDGVLAAAVSHADAAAQIDYDPARVSREQLAAAITAAGYLVVT